MEYEGLKIGPRIRKLRKEKHMTLEELSDAVKVSASHISQIEQGGRRMSVDLLYKLMNVLDVDANTLLVIPGCDKYDSEVSVDEELSGLTIEQQSYLKSIFLQMIRKMPV